MRLHCLPQCPSFLPNAALYHPEKQRSDVPPHLTAAAHPLAQVNSYRAFADDVLPRIKKAGYNTVQLMAVMARCIRFGFSRLRASCVCAQQQPACCCHAAVAGHAAEHP